MNTKNFLLGALLVVMISLQAVLWVEITQMNHRFDQFITDTEPKIDLLTTKMQNLNDQNNQTQEQPENNQQQGDSPFSRPPAASNDENDSSLDLLDFDNSNDSNDSNQ
jgi:hypothetical protein